MNPEKLINWGELSRLLSGSRMTVRRNAVPKKHRQIVEELLQSVEAVMAKMPKKSGKKRDKGYGI